jgi:undecaprenyl-diphosphatase
VVNNARLGWQIIIATIPIIIAGLLAKDFIETSLRSPIIIAIASIVFGVWLWLADRSNVKRIALFDITWRIAIIIGLMQVLALIPGTSRSGITLTVAFLLAVESKSAAKFSFLLSIPTILGAALLLFKDAYETNLPLDLWSLFFGALISGIAAYLCIHFFIKALERIGMLPFMIYRILLGLFLLIVFL